MSTWNLNESSFISVLWKLHEKAVPLWVGASVRWVCVGMSASHSSGLDPDSQPHCPPCTPRSLRYVPPCRTANSNTHGDSKMLHHCMRAIYSVWVTNEPIIVHDSYEQANLVDVLRRNIKHNGFIVHWVQSVALGWCLPLLQPPAFTHQGHFNIWIWREVACSMVNEDAKIYWHGQPPTN